MANGKQWQGKTRRLKLAMAVAWIPILQLKMAFWQIPGSLVEELIALVAVATLTLEAVESKATRSEDDTARCDAAFKDMVVTMSYLKDRYFRTPPLTEVDFISLQLRKPVSTKTKRNQPQAMLLGEIIRSVTARLKVVLHYTSGSEALQDPHSDIFYQWRRSLYNPLNPTTVTATGEIDFIPTDPLHLPLSYTTGSRTEVFNYAQGDSGKIAYFDVRLSNGTKGKSSEDESMYGPWCPIFSAVVP
ncbi:hypothetical protein FACS1894200_01340 [Spirochaetia bacterium]|nr:hypothetical protein FACS1894200_01340 [Spirochaetia bacterium]